MAVTAHDLVMEAKAQIREVPPAEAQTMLGKRVLLDVREYDEYAASHLSGAINIPLNALPARLKEVPADKPVIVVCATGNRSRSGASAFARAGYAEVYNLQGGTMRWMMQRRPIKA